MKIKNKKFLTYSNKKGSHVGIVLSFTIFITFLIFLYSALEPSLKIDQDRESTLDYLEIELVEAISENFTSIIIRNDTVIEAGVTCIELKDLLTDLEIDSRTIIKDENENPVIASASEDHLYVDKGENSIILYKLYNSEEFNSLGEELVGGCAGISDCDDDEKCQSLENEEEGYIVGIYFIGLVKKSEKIFLSKIGEFLEDYNSRYDELKEELKLSPGTEFGFSFTYNETGVRTDEEEITGNVYAREIPIQYVDENANIWTGFINIQVWG